MGGGRENTSGFGEDVIAKTAGYQDFPATRSAGSTGPMPMPADEQIQTSDPYPIRGGIAQSGDFMNMANSLYNYESMRSLDFFVVSDFLAHSSLADVADIIVPCAHWLEANATRPSQGSSGGMGLNVQCVERPGEVKYDVVFNIELFKAMGVPFSADSENPWPTEEELLATGLCRLPV